MRVYSVVWCCYSNSSVCVQTHSTFKQSQISLCTPPQIYKLGILYTPFSPNTVPLYQTNHVYCNSVVWCETLSISLSNYSWGHRIDTPPQLWMVYAYKNPQHGVVFNCTHTHTTYPQWGDLLSHTHSQTPVWESDQRLSSVWLVNWCKCVAPTVCSWQWKVENLYKYVLSPRDGINGKVLCYKLKISKTKQSRFQWLLSWLLHK